MATADEPTLTPATCPPLWNADAPTLLGALLWRTGRVKDAERSYEAGRALFKQRAVDFPRRPDYRQDLAVCHVNLGKLLGETDRLSLSEAAFHEALAIQKRLVAAFPAAPAYLTDLAKPAIAQAKYADACRWLTEALPHCRAALRTDLRNGGYRTVCRDNRQALAEARLALGDHAAAAAAANEMVQSGADPVNDPYNAACCLARCVRLAPKDSKLSERQRRKVAADYAARAVDRLRQAVAPGFKDAEHMKKDKDLDPLRGRRDFHKVLGELEGKMAPRR